MRETPQGSRVLVTGANGFLGTRTIRALRSRGYAVRAFVLSGTEVAHIKHPGVDIVFGDVGEAGSLAPAFEGVDLAVHTAADTTGTEEGGRKITIQGTGHVLDLAREHGLRKLVYISSCSVYGVAGMEKNRVVREDAPLEPRPGERGPYSWAKWEAERLVAAAMQKGGVPIVCLRPGVIYGPGGDLFNAMLGYSIRERVFVVMGDGTMRLPLVHVDDVAKAIVLALESETSGGKTYNLVDPDEVDKRTYVNAVVRRKYPKATVLYLPLSLLGPLVGFQELFFDLLGREPFLTRYRLESSQNPVIFDASRIADELGWRPGEPFLSRAEALLGTPDPGLSAHEE